MPRLQSLSSFLRWERAAGKAASTLRNHHRALMHLDARLEDRDIDGSAVSALQLVEFICEMRERYTPDDVNAHVSACRRFFRWLSEVGLRADNPAANLRFIAAPAKPVESLRPEEVRALLSFCHRCGNARFGTRRGAFLSLFLIDTGLRLGEALALRLGDLDLIENRITVWAPKTRRLDLMPIAPTLRRQLLAYLQARNLHLSRHHLPDCGLLFVSESGTPLDRVSAERNCQTVARAAGLTRRVWPHLFRHTFAVQSLLNGAPPTAVKQLMRLRGRAFDRYANMSTDQLADVQVKASPLLYAAQLRFIVPDDEQEKAA